ncbi:MAG: hypothetical protein ABSB70_24950, partial [Candidatus Velthaea sp.]
IDGRVEGPIERVECSDISKCGIFDTPRDEPITPPFELVVNEQTQEIEGAQIVGASLLCAYTKGISHSSKAKLT